MQMGSRPNGEPLENAREPKRTPALTGRRDGRNSEPGAKALGTRAELMTLADAGRSELLAAGISLDDCYEEGIGLEGREFGGEDVAEDDLERQYRVWRLALVRKRVVSGFYEQLQIREQIVDKLTESEFGNDNTG